MKSNITRIVGAAMALSLALGACSSPSSSAPAGSAPAGSTAPGSSASAPATVQEKVLTIGTPYTVSTFVPWKSTSDGDRYILSNVYESLVEYDSAGSFIPGLAESWENPDPKTWIFKLRQNSYWQTGNALFNEEKLPVTAKDVKATFDFVMDEKNESVRRSSLSSTIESIEVVDDFTIQFVTKNAEALFLSPISNIYLFPVKAPETGFDLSKTPVGSGPYKFEKYATDDQTVLVKNDNYYIAPGLDKVIYKIIPDKAVAAIALQNNEIDIAVTLLSTDLSAVAKKDTLSLISNPLGWYRYMGFNVSDPLFADKDMRKAISMAVDVDSAVTAMFKNDANIKLGVRAYGPVPLELPGADEAAWKAAGAGYDPAGAKALIESKGYTMGSDGFYQKDGKQLGFTLKTVNTDPNMKFGVIISTELKKIGVNCIAQPTEYATLTSDIKASNVQAFVMGGGSTLDGQNMLFHTEKSKTTAHKTNYSNPALDKKLDEAFGTIDDAQRDQLLIDTSVMAVSDFVHLPGFFEYVQVGMNKRVQDFEKRAVLWPSLTNSFRNVTIA